jgi:hypothetical protein
MAYRTVGIDALAKYFYSSLTLRSKKEYIYTFFVISSSFVY